MVRTRSGEKNKRKQYVDYSSLEEAEDVEYVGSSEDEKPKKKKASSRVPKKKLKKSTEERIKEVVGDSQNNEEEVLEENGNDMVDEGESANINTKRLLDARSKKAKRMDWEQGFFYLPKFDCYLPRHILHMILEYVPPFPYFLNIRSVSQQWLDDFDTVICQNVKELDLVQRNDIDYEQVKYNFPWNDSSTNTRRNNDCIRFLAILFPNIEKLIVPAIGSTVRLPQNVLNIFSKLQTMEIFYVSPLILDVAYNPGELPLTYKQEITDIQSIDGRYFAQFSSIVMRNDEGSKLITIDNVLIPEKVISLFNYLVKEQHFSLKRLDILSLSENIYSKTLIDFIIEENVKHVERGYGSPKLTPHSQSLFIMRDDIADYMLEKQFFKNLISSEDIESYDWYFISKILASVGNFKIFKMLFEQAGFPLVFEGDMNPLLRLITKNNTAQLPQIIELLCEINPSLASLGDENGFINGDEKNANILQLYIRKCNNDYHIEDSVIASLIKIGCDTKYVCPTTGNNLIHFHPCSSSLIDSLPLEFIQMKNNKGYNPLERFVKRIEIENNIRQDDILLAIDAFGKVFRKYNLSINEIRFEKNQNLLHKFINLTNLSKSNNIIEKLITNGVDSNIADDDDYIPLFYYLERGKRVDVDFLPLINSISEETLCKRFKGKSLLANVIERFKKDENINSFYMGSYTTNITILGLIENLLSRGCKLNDSLIELSNDPYVKDNLELNTSLFLVQILYNLTSSNLETVRKIFKYFENFEDLLIRPFAIYDSKISPLLFLIATFKNGRNNRQIEIHQFFQSDNPVIPPKLLENIIDIPNKKIDALFYTITSRSIVNWQYLEAILDIKVDSSATFWYRQVNYTDLVSYFESYRYNDEVLGSLNVIQLATIMGATQMLSQIEKAFKQTNSNEKFKTLTSEQFKSGDLVLDGLAKRGLFDVGNSFIRNNTIPLKWNLTHFRTAFEFNHFYFCYQVISDTRLKHDFTKEEMTHIIIGYILRTGDLEDRPNQLNIAQVISNIFGSLTLIERFKLFSTRLKVAFNNGKEKWDNIRSRATSNNWTFHLENTAAEANSAWTISQAVTVEPKVYNISLLDVCYCRGLLYILLYIALGDLSGRKRKNILTYMDLNEEVVTEWLSSKIESTGKTILHLLCEKPQESRNTNVEVLACKTEMVNDLVKYLSSINREDIANIQDNNGDTPLFCAIHSNHFINFFIRITDLSIKNNKGESAKDIMSEADLETYASFFEVKEEKPKKPTTKKQKKETKEKAKPKKKTTKRKKKESSDEEEEEEEDEMANDDDEEFIEKKKPRTRSSSKRK